MAERDLEALAERLAAPEAERPVLDVFRHRALARIQRRQPVTPEQRLAEFRRLNFVPHGLFLPEDPTLRAELEAERRAAQEARSLARYHALQRRATAWAEQGLPGRWTGQQAVARSRAQFRLVKAGRRSGKSWYAAHEALAVARIRPRAVVWVVAPTYDLAGRIFSMIADLCDDFGVRLARRSMQPMLLQLAENGSRIEGKSADNVGSLVGEGLDLAVLDEAAQLTGDVFERALLPSLTNRDGQALIISSLEDDADWFSTTARTRADDPDWAVFSFPSWDNVYEFPGGRADRRVQLAERNMAAFDFLQQFGAVDATPPLRVYREWRQTVHVRDDPPTAVHDAPVVLGVDPSAGINPYAVVALADLGDALWVIDEHYRAGVTAEEVIDDLRARPWWDRVTTVVVDPAFPTEVRRWQQYAGLGWPVPDKPKVQDRIPLHRIWLRHPLRWSVHRRALLRELGLGEPASPEEELHQELELERLTSDDAMTPAVQERLRDCARLFVLPHCTSTIAEHRLWRYRRRRAGLGNPEEPVDADNHCLDAIGYVLWALKRQELHAVARSYLRPVEPVETAPLAPDVQPRSWLEAVRRRVDRRPSYLRTV